MPERKPAHCPICGRETELAAAPLGPFCSDRCKLVDLGKWFGEEYRVSEPLRPDHFTEFEGAEGDDLDRPQPG
ncbi:MAG: DNA gyrase inhibitor YacG [Chthoniobacteraceae bacterium]